MTCVDRLGQWQRPRRLARRFDQPDERRERRRRLALQRARARRLPQRRSLRARRILQLLERARADAARRKVDDAQECAVVAGLREQAQVRERMLDFRALEEAHAAVDAVRQRGVEQRMLEHARLRVAAIEQRDLVERQAVVDETLDRRRR